MPFHVRITLKGRPRRVDDVIVLDKDADWIEEHIGGPRRRGCDIVIEDRTLAWADIDHVRITETKGNSKGVIHQLISNRLSQPLLQSTPVEWLVTAQGRDVTEQFITGAPHVDAGANAAQATGFAQNRKAVMVIYGHDIEAKDALFGWLRSIGLQPQEWSHLVSASGSGSPYIGQVLHRAFQQAQAVVALFTPDEQVRGRENLPAADTGPRLQARPNVFIEAGMALVTHPDRTILVTLGIRELPSDLAGRHHVRLSHTTGPLNEMASLLEAAGCEIDKTGTDWLDPSRFPDRDTTAHLTQGGNPVPVSEPADGSLTCEAKPAHDQGQRAREDA